MIYENRFFPDEKQKNLKVHRFPQAIFVRQFTKNSEIFSFTVKQDFFLDGKRSTGASSTVSL